MEERKEQDEPTGGGPGDPTARAAAPVRASDPEGWLFDRFTEAAVLVLPLDPTPGGPGAGDAPAYANAAARRALAATGGRLPAAWGDVVAAVAAGGTGRALPDAYVHVDDGAADGVPDVRVLAGDAWPHADEAGAPAGAGVVFRDVTERRRADQLARLREGAITAAANAIILTDCRQPDNPIIYVNPAFARITGYAPEESLGRNCRFLQAHDRDQPEVARLREAVARGESVMVVLRNYRKDGTLFWNELRVAPVRNARGEVTHMVGVQDDITERVRAEQEVVRRSAELERARDDLQDQAVALQEATQSRDRFMATVSHEMRTPVNATLGYVEYLLLGLAGELTPAQRASLERVRRSNEQLLDLINDVLDLSRAEVGRLEVELGPVDLVAAADEAVALLAPQAERKRVALALTEPATAPGALAAEAGASAASRLPAARGDLRRVRQVLLNLVQNAVKFTEEGGRVAVRVRAVPAPVPAPAGPDRTGPDQAADDTPGGPEARPTRVEAEVEDTGVGIHEKQLPHVFDEFYQGDAGAARRHAGAGIGLAVARRLARLMGGDLRVRSTLGRGSTFTLSLPVAAEDDDAAARPEALPAVASAGAMTASLGHAAASANAAAAEAADSDATAAPVPAVVVFGPTAATVAALGRTLYPDLRLVHVTAPEAVTPAVRAEHAALVALDVTAGAGEGWQVAHDLREDHTLDEVPILLLPSARADAAAGADASEDGSTSHTRVAAAALDLGAVAFAAKVPSPAPHAGAGGRDVAVPDPGAADRLARAVERAAAAGAERVAAAAPTAGERDPRLRATGARPDVLVVDDDPDGRRMTARILANAGADVREADGGEAGLVAMRRRRPDVAVVDLMMPVLDGFGVLAAMRADPRLRGVPVVVLTAKSLSAPERAFLTRTAERVLERGEHRLSDVATLILRAATRR